MTRLGMVMDVAAVSHSVKWFQSLLGPLPTEFASVRLPTLQAMLGSASPQMSSFAACISTFTVQSSENTAYANCADLTIGAASTGSSSIEANACVARRDLFSRIVAIFRFLPIDFTIRRSVEPTPRHERRKSFERIT
jgi:hypothetical protein